MCHMFLGIILIQLNSIHNLVQTKKKLPGSKPPIQPKGWQKKCEKKSVPTEDLPQRSTQRNGGTALAPVARKPRTASIAHKGAIEGPDLTGASLDGFIFFSEIKGQGGTCTPSMVFIVFNLGILGDQKTHKYPLYRAYIGISHDGVRW